MTEEIHRSLGRLEGKLDLILAAQKAASDQHSALDNRVRTVETEVTSMKTTSGLIASGASFIVSIGAALLPNIFHK